MKNKGKTLMAQAIEKKREWVQAERESAGGIDKDYIWRMTGWGEALAWMEEMFCPPEVQKETKK